MFLIGGNVDEIVAFVRVGFEIIEAIAIPDTVIVDVFVTVRSDGEAGRHGREIPFPVVFVEDVFAPVRHSLTEEKRSE